MPGRPVFNEILKRIQKGEAQAVICWRLAAWLVIRSTAAFAEVLRTKSQNLLRELSRLTGLYIAQDIKRDDYYLERRRSLVSDRKSVEERAAKLEKGASAWLEPDFAKQRSPRKPNE